MNKFIKFISSKVFLFNLAGLALFAIIVIAGTLIYLKSFTKHGETLTVPNLVGLQPDEAQKIVNERNLNIVISDSVYHDFFEKGAIVEQFPRPDHKVKEGRKIYLITNCILDEMVDMPQFTGYSIRQVQSMAETYGLKIGNLKYIPDIAVNVVIRQYHKGAEITPGTRIPKGSTIDLLVGLGLSDRKTMVPNLIGLNYKEAGDKLLDEYLNVGALYFDNTVKTRADSASARIFRQSPVRSTINLVNLGYNIDIWLTTDSSLINPISDEDEEEPEDEE